MEKLGKINASHEIDIQLDPTKADIVFTSIDSQGSPGSLNSFVLKTLGYTTSNLPQEFQLRDGYTQLSGHNRSTIIFVVTLANNGNDSRVNLKNNFLSALRFFQDLFKDKKVWVPLMGTGSAGLDLVESYTIIAEVLNVFVKEYRFSVHFLVSIPESRQGREIIKELNSSSIDLSRWNTSLLKSKFYLGGTVWGRVDQIERFLQNGIWEKGQNGEEYSDLINSINRGDLLILKSTFASNYKSILRIKAVGIVKLNPRDGAKLLIDWRVKDIAVDIDNLGHYRNTISQLSREDFATVFSQIDSQSRKILYNELVGLSRKGRVAGVISDSDEGIDYLHISADVNAFAKVIASNKFQPPLAIALFGQWGSGKSFFMKKLKDRISVLSRLSEGYCSGIVHIRFNAWSYMDSNLWASIVTKIFEHLDEYISENSASEIAKSEIKRELTSKLTIAKEEIDILSVKKESLSEQISSLTRRRIEITDEIKRKLTQLGERSLKEVLKNLDREFQVESRIEEALNKNESIITTRAEVAKIIPEQYWQRPEEAYRLAGSWITFLRIFFKKEDVALNFIIIILVFVAVSIIPIVVNLFTNRINGFNLVIPQVLLLFFGSLATIWKRTRSVFGELQPVILSFWQIKEDYNKAIEHATADFQRQERALESAIDEKKSELLLVNDQISRSEALKSDLQFRIDNALATETLYSFIDRKSKGEDYKKYLGIISTVRKDFDILTNLFLEHRKETGRGESKSIFKDKFKKPLERIVLYIDDLDRCPSDNVLQVLEAVNLLMAFELFVVVVGVDIRWVRNALLSAHSNQFFKDSHRISSQTDQAANLIQPSQYLEKIFQVPFHLALAGDEQVKGMIRTLVENNVLEVGSDKLPINRRSVDNGKDNKPESIPAEYEKVEQGLLENGAEAQYTDVEPLAFSQEEVDLMASMSVILGSNPRAIKRFVNVYRIVRAHDEFDPVKTELAVILFTIALPLGPYRDLSTSFEDFIYEETSNLADFYSYTLIEESDPSLTSLKSNMADALFKNIGTSILKNMSKDSFKQQYKFLRRFSFGIS